MSVPPATGYLRAVDPFPLEAADFTKLHEFYARLGQGRLSTTRCARCGRDAWPPRGFCPECGSDEFGWIDLPSEGAVHAFTVQETGLPAGFDGPRVFAVVTVGGHRVFTVLLDADPARLAIGQPVRLVPLAVADDPRGNRRWLPAFTPSA
jgi:uncharacterized OB-fold protein